MWLDNLRRMKESRGLSVRQIAEGANLPAPTVEKIFTGATKDPRLPTMQTLVQYLGYTLDDLFQEDQSFDVVKAQEILKEYGIIPQAYNLTGDDVKYLQAQAAALRVWFSAK